MNRDKYLLKHFGITQTQWDAIYEHQHGLCPICLRPIHRPGNAEGKQAASVEHDHKTKRVRGLVHHECNRFKVGTNTAETARRVLAYLESDFDGRS